MVRRFDFPILKREVFFLTPFSRFFSFYLRWNDERLKDDHKLDFVIILLVAAAVTSVSTATGQKAARVVVLETKFK